MLLAMFWVTGGCSAWGTTEEAAGGGALWGMQGKGERQEAVAVLLGLLRAHPLVHVVVLCRRNFSA